MSYLAFALKYRPQTFDEVVGQDHVVTSLKNAILKNRVHHAYLFSGTRGVGKTSLARIFAKSLNCEQGPTVTPCGKCLSCQSIVQGNSLDIIEIDGASNRGIDEMRALRESVKLATTHSRYKIYIIDEVHMLTQEAFNALLKTLEEPPAHVKFIFATTHPQKVLPTILSRCQKFGFNLLSVEVIVAKLKRLIKEEGVDVAEDVLYAIARSAGGSIRDAESLLDQIVPVIMEKTSLTDIFSFLGIIEEPLLNEMLEKIVNKDIDAILALIEKIVSQGKDLSVFVLSLIEHLRNLLLSKVSKKSFDAFVDLSLETKKFCLDLSTKISTSDLLRCIDRLLEVKKIAQVINTTRVPLELSLIKFVSNETAKNAVVFPAATKPHVIKPAPMIEKKVIEDKSAPEDDFKKALENFGKKDSSKDNLVNVSQNSHKQSQVNVSEEEDFSQHLLEIKASWPSILSKIQKVRAAIASHLAYARLIGFNGKVIVIAFDKKDSFHKEVVESIKNLQSIESYVSQYLGKSVGIKFVEDVDSLSKKEEVKVKEESNNENNGFIHELLDTFGGNLHTED